MRKQIQLIIERLIEEGTHIEWTDGYAEPGYDSEKGVVFANWNPEHMDRLGSILERDGYDIEYHDEWSTCCRCNKAFRVSPDSYHWTPHYKLLEGEASCLDCIDDEEALELVMNNPTEVDTEGRPWQDHGFRRLKGFSVGFHRHCDSEQDAMKCLDAIQERGFDFVLQLTSKTQFETTFDVLVRSSSRS